MSKSESQGPSRRAVVRSAVAGSAAAALSKVFGCSEAHIPMISEHAKNGDASRFLKQYTHEFQRLYTQLQEAQWIAATDVTDEHTAASVKAQNAFDAFVGEKQRMEEIAALREQSWRNEPIVSRQLERTWLNAASAPGTIPELVKQRAEAEAEQAKTLNGYAFEIKNADGSKKKVTANDIDEILQKSGRLDERLAAWTASKEIGVALRPGLTKLQKLRNGVSRELHFSSLLGLNTAADSIGVRELMELMTDVLEQTRPLYEQLHCYAKHTLAKRFEQPVPRRIPAHWLPNRWGQEWPGLVEGVDLDPLFKDKTPLWIVQQAERFWMSMGFPKLPATFWKKSDLWDVPSTEKRKKNRHASAWHIDLESDIRSLMSVKNNWQWFTTAHHELGHAYYDMSYTRPAVPILLRDGANGCFHEAMGDLIALASSQRPYLAEIGLMKADAGGDPIRWLLADALGSTVVFMPFTCGTMTGWEYNYYEKDLPANQFNAKWWELAGKHQGIDPPSPRGEEFCDAASKTHINDAPAYYYKYAVGHLILHQFHDYIAKKILKQDPHNCSYYNRKDVGEYLREMLKLGMTRDWRQVLRDFTGEDLSARALMEYYAPLTDYLKKENAGRDASFA